MDFIKTFLFVACFVLLVSSASALTTISNCSQVQDIANNVSEDYQLTGNVDCSETTTWNAGAGFTPIGSFGNKFIGSLDGDGNNITNLYINNTGNGFALFGWIENAEIRNLGLIDEVVTSDGNANAGLVSEFVTSNITNSFVTGEVYASQNCGGLVSEANAEALINNSYFKGKVICQSNGGGFTAELIDSTIQNSYFDGNLILTDVGAGGVGGLAGDVQIGIIDNSHFIGNITLTNTGASGFGGIVGTANNLNLSNSYALINITSPTDTLQLVGGLLGSADRSIINNSYVIGSINAQANVGGLIGVINSDSQMYNSYFIGSIYATNVYVGGLVSQSASSSTIDNSSANVNIVCNARCGGLVGDGGETITQSYSEGTIHSTSGNYVGGLAGFNDAPIKQSFSFVDVTASTGTFVGGLVGYYQGALINNSYSRGNVFGDDVVGGLVGGSETEISNSYSTGSVIGNGLVTGGLLAENEASATCTNSYWDTDTSGQGSSFCGYGNTTAELQTQSTFEGWDFSNIWAINPSDYPCLQFNCLQFTPPASLIGVTAYLTSDYSGVTGDADINAYVSSNVAGIKTSTNFFNLFIVLASLIVLVLISIVIIKSVRSFQGGNEGA
jgi:hypothetical protein